MVFGIGKWTLISDKYWNPEQEDKGNSHCAGSESEILNEEFGCVELDLTMPNNDAHLERLRTKARNEIGEKEDLIPEQIAKVRAIIAEDSNFFTPSEKLDYKILQCLRARKYNIERAAKMFKKFIVVRNDVSDMVDKLSPSVNIDLYEKNFTAVLSSRDPLGRQIIFIRIDRWASQTYSLDWVLAAVFLQLDEALETIDTQLHGIVAIIDFKGFGFSHARTVRPARIQTIVNILQDSYPIRFKELHFLNHPTIFNMVYAIAKPFLKEKMTKRIYFHGHDLSSLHKVISPSILPKSVGGHLSEEEYPDKELVSRLLTKDAFYAEFCQLMQQCVNF